jgi:hypothetical protein
MSVSREKAADTSSKLVLERNSRHTQCRPPCDCMCTESRHCGTHAYSGGGHNKAGRFCTQSAAVGTDEMFVRKAAASDMCPHSHTYM